MDSSLFLLDSGDHLGFRLVEQQDDDDLDGEVLTDEVSFLGLNPPV